VHFDRAVHVVVHFVCRWRGDDGGFVCHFENLV
jgi:hypothetical protein